MLTLDSYWLTCELWTEPREFSRAEAWLDLQLFAAPVGVVTCPLSMFVRRWKWERTKVSRMLFDLEQRNMISVKSGEMHTITITNKDVYTKRRTLGRKCNTLPEYSERFLAFWVKYPKNNGSKKAAWRKWIQYDCDKRTISPVLSAYLKYAWQDREPQHIPHAATWLNQEPWDQELPQPYKPITTIQQSKPASDNTIDSQSLESVLGWMPPEE